MNHQTEIDQAVAEAAKPKRVRTAEEVFAAMPYRIALASILGRAGCYRGEVNYRNEDLLLNAIRKIADEAEEALAQ